jgi:hypothetical protein
MDTQSTQDTDDIELAEAEVRMRASLGLPIKGQRPTIVVQKHFRRLTYGRDRSSDVPSSSR